MTKFDQPSIHWSMLVPLLCMALAFTLYYCTVLLMRARVELLDREQRSRWVQELVSSKFAGRQLEQPKGEFQRRSPHMVGEQNRDFTHQIRKKTSYRIESNHES